MAEKQEKKGMSPLAAGVIGAAAGIAVGMAAGALTDPKKREKLKASANKLKNSASNVIKKLEKNAGEMRDNAMKEGNELKEMAKEELAHAKKTLKKN